MESPDNSHSNTFYIVYTSEGDAMVLADYALTTTTHQMEVTL